MRCAPHCRAFRGSRSQGNISSDQKLAAQSVVLVPCVGVVWTAVLGAATNVGKRPLYQHQQHQQQQFTRREGQRRHLPSRGDRVPQGQRWAVPEHEQIPYGKNWIGNSRNFSFFPLSSMEAAGRSTPTRAGTTLARVPLLLPYCCCWTRIPAPGA